MTPPPANLPPLAELPDWQLVAEALRILGNVPPGYGADLSLAIVAEAARRGLVDRLNVKRYGRRTITSMLADWNDLRRIVADTPDPALQAAFDLCEEWVGFAMGGAGMKGEGDVPSQTA